LPDEVEWVLDKSYGKPSGRVCVNSEQDIWKTKLPLKISMATFQQYATNFFLRETAGRPLLDFCI
jgi:hypothetical protein